MKLTPEEKDQRARERMIDTSRQFQIGTYSRQFVAPIFQLVVRAEAAAQPEGEHPAMVEGKYSMVFRLRGQCVCITCGCVGPWKGNAIGGGTIETGHFLASRRASILFEESNAHPQCKSCNRRLSGNQALYEVWMQHAYGQEEIDRLRTLKGATRNFGRGELVDMRLCYAARLKAAVEKMLTGVLVVG